MEEVNSGVVINWGSEGFSSAEGVSIEVGCDAAVASAGGFDGGSISLKRSMPMTIWQSQWPMHLLLATVEVKGGGL